MDPAGKSQGADSTGESHRLASDAVELSDTDVLQIGTRAKGAVRVNLSVPREVHEVLEGLSRKTGASKAGLVMNALRQMLPELRRQLAEHDEVEAYIRRKQAESSKNAVLVHPFEAKLPRAERRRLERERRRRQAGGGHRE